MWGRPRCGVTPHCPCVLSVICVVTSAMRHWLLYLWFLLIVRPIVRLLLGVSVHGREHLRFTRPTLFVANHNSHLDAAVLMDLMRLRDLQKVRPVAAAD